MRWLSSRSQYLLATLAIAAALFAATALAPVSSSARGRFQDFADGAMLLRAARGLEAAHKYATAADAYDRAARAFKAEGRRRQHDQAERKSKQLLKLIAEAQKRKAKNHKPRTAIQKPKS